MGEGDCLKSYLHPFLNMGKYCDADNGRPPGPPPPQTAFKRGPPEKKARADEKVLGGNETQNIEFIFFLRLEAQKRI